MPEGFEVKSSVLKMYKMLVAIVERKYPFPFRTRKSSSLTPMILPQGGKVGSCRTFFFDFSFFESFLNSIPSVYVFMLLSSIWKIKIF